VTTGQEIASSSMSVVSFAGTLRAENLVDYHGYPLSLQLTLASLVSVDLFAWLTSLQAILEQPL
jgi:hypothetical protein